MNIYSVTAPRHRFLLGNDDTNLFETSKINNHSVTAPSAKILLGDENVQFFETKKNNPSVTAPIGNIFKGSGSLHFQHKNRTHMPVHKLHPPGKCNICFKIDGETAHAAKCYKSHPLNKSFDLFI